MPHHIYENDVKCNFCTSNTQNIGDTQFIDDLDAIEL